MMDAIREAANRFAAIENAGKAEAAKNVGLCKSRLSLLTYLQFPTFLAMFAGAIWEIHDLRINLKEQIKSNAAFIEMNATDHNDLSDRFALVESKMQFIGEMFFVTTNE